LEFFRTPRDVVRSFVGPLNLLDQNPGKTWQDLQRDRFDEYLPDAPLQPAFIFEMLDLRGAQAAALRGCPIDGPQQSLA
jgi:hypothetical protein